MKGISLFVIAHSLILLKCARSLTIKISDDENPKPLVVTQ